MAIFKKTLPASLRADSLGVRDTRTVVASDRRPYLIPPGQRNPATATSRRQLALFPHEPEDARLTGATRSLYRRLLALNLPRAEKRIDPSPQLVHEITDVRKPLPGARIA